MNVYFVSVLLLRQTTRQQFIRFCVGGANWALCRTCVLLCGTRNAHCVIVQRSSLLPGIKFPSNLSVPLPLVEPRAAGEGPLAVAGRVGDFHSLQ